MVKIDIAANKAKQTVKQLATKGDVKSARILAREVVRSNKQKDRLSVSKARLGSIGHQLTEQMGASRAMSQWLVLISEYSNDESHGISAEVDGDYEVVQSTCKATSDQSDDEGNEHGDDQGIDAWCFNLTSIY